MQEIKSLLSKVKQKQHCSMVRFDILKKVPKNPLWIHDDCFLSRVQNLHQI